MVALVAILACLISIVAALVILRRTAKKVEQFVLAPKEETVDLSALVIRVRALSRLETAAMRVIHISTVTQSYNMVPNAIAGDQLTFLATGDVIAGIDLSQLKQEDVWREPDGTIVLRLPQSQILVSRIDNRESKVMSRKTGMLRRGDINLESRARQHAEAGVRREALNKGILPLANQNAQTKLADFLHTLGFQKVKFVSGAPVPPSQL
jgi:hypothetical protein